MPRLEEFFKKYAKGRGVTVADQLAVEVRRVLSVKAPIRRTASGKLVAATPAIPFAPPRMVTGALRNSVKVIPTTHGARLVIWKPYGLYLEMSKRYHGWPHKFLAVALRKLGIKGRSSSRILRDSGGRFS